MDMRSSFLADPIVVIPHQFDRLVEHRAANTLHIIQIQACRDPTNFAAIEDFRKNLSTFLVNLSRHHESDYLPVSQ